MSFFLGNKKNQDGFWKKQLTTILPIFFAKMGFKKGRVTPWMIIQTKCLAYFRVQRQKLHKKSYRMTEY